MDKKPFVGLIRDHRTRVGRIISSQKEGEPDGRKSEDKDRDQ